MTLADGFISSVQDKGVANAISSLSLSSVIYIPKFLFNFLSIGRITRSLNCSMIFFLKHCLFQKLRTRNTIGTGCECGELYYLKMDSKSIAYSSFVSAFDQHYRLGGIHLYKL